ncbi:DUF4231 domain-containing protein [Saccharopolyspora rosea]|uniref:DUF4231 domain-containing protein n=1 Tax=Saccharopolyspora rosea TaxID=524884 RepID=UPI0021D9527D|nr:DUF4231 domain-containing protein [Saccharopolyspora rosea]
MSSVYPGESFNQWVKRALSARGHEDLSEELSPETLRRRIVKLEYELKTVRLCRNIFTWLSILLLVAASLLVFLHLCLNFLPNVWLFYPVVAAFLLALCATAFVGFRLAWRIVSQYSYIVELREFYKSRLSDEVDTRSESDDKTLLKLHRQYREDSVTVMEEYRSAARKYKRWHDWFQTIAIIGSVTTSAIATASVYFSVFRSMTIGVSLVVGITTGINGYYKFRERSFNLQQASDLIEREYHSVALRVGRYLNCKNEAEAYRLFAQQVESIRDEQNKRQQQLEQPVETKKEE